jgi:hypothetical protein
MEEIQLKAILTEIKTTRDGGWKIVLEVDSSETAPIMHLSVLRDCVMSVAITPDENESGAV